jgi:hypothetical protein
LTFDPGRPLIELGPIHVVPPSVERNTLEDFANIRIRLFERATAMAFTVVPVDQEEASVVVVGIAPQLVPPSVVRQTRYEPV